MSLSYNIDKLFFIGDEISSNTPLIIIEDLADTVLLKIDKSRLNNLIYRAKVLVSLDSRRPKPVVTPFDNDDLIRIANFLNPDDQVEWEIERLINSFLRIQNILIFNKIPNNAEWGNPSPRHPDRIPIFVLYRWLTKLGLKICSESSLKDLEHAYNLSKKSPSYLRTYLHHLVNEMNHSQLIKFAAQLSPFNPEPDPTYQPDQLGLNFKDLELEAEACLAPLTHRQAVMFSLHYHHRDISASINPRAEFVAYKLKLPTIDPHMNQIEKLNPLAYDIRHTFNHNIPLEFYDEHAIERMSGSSSPREDLALISLTDSFHLGVVHGVHDFITPIEREDVRLLPSPLPPIISYGSGNDFAVYMVNELSDMFEVNQAFANPKGGFYSIEAINRLTKLIKLAKSSRARNRGTKRVDLWSRLESVVKLVMSYQDEKHAWAVKLGQLWYRLDVDRKIYLKTLLDHIMTMGMYMRGWVETDPRLPINMVPTSDEERTKVIVAKSFGRLDVLVSESPFLEDSPGVSIASFVLDLPLLKYERGEYHPSTNPNYGLTLGERLDLTRQGEDVKNINSCVRTSSNWFVATSYRYSTIIGHKPDFNIGDLRRID